jgi:hypothetical protein
VSIILRRADGADLKVNAWNWGVLHYLVAAADVLPRAAWEPKRYNGGGDLDASQVQTLVAFLSKEVLPRLKEGERMFFDGTVTDVPDDGTFYRAESETWKNYSLQHPVLVEIIVFLEAARGPVCFL